MTSIVITPFDDEHAAELKDFLWDKIERADFEVFMPPSVELVDVRGLRETLEDVRDWVTTGQVDGVGFDAPQIIEAINRALNPSQTAAGTKEGAPC